MAIRFNSDLNAEIRRTVRNFNKKVVRAEKRGFRNLPDTVKVSELKSRYENRSQLVRELKRLQNFKRGDILTRIENQGGARAVAWQFDFIKSNVKEARKYFEREYERVSKRLGKYPGERLYADTVASKINFLEQNINYLSQSQFRSVLSAVREFYNAPRNREAQYRGFLSEVEWVMEQTGIPKEERDVFFKKFAVLTPSQFLYAYQNNPIIERIYNLYQKREDGETYLTDTEENATDLMDTLMEDVDDIVKDAKLNVD